jgi:ribosomal protein S18 acetylase RimI-like enzyme
MEQGHDISLSVEATPASRRSRALWLVLADGDAAHRAAQVAASLSSAQQGKLALDGLIEARRNGRLVGAAWAQVVAGRMAVVWGAQLVAGEPEATAQQLHAALDEYCQRHGVCFAQASLSTAAAQVETRLRASGYRHAAEIRYLACTLDDLQFHDQQDDESQPARTALQFESFTAANHDRLAAIVERTYEQTLDCPDLNGVRETCDVLEGYRQSGVFASERWMIVRHAHRDVGCLLLADYPEQDQWELVYMGLVPEARGKRHGLQITHHAQQLARDAGRQRLVLAVDATNAPALAMYCDAGFTAWEERRVFLKFFHPASRA